MGAEHDEKTSKCSSSSDYIMSESGSTQNIFSRCSIDVIQREIDTTENEDRRRLEKCLKDLPKKNNDENFSICEQTNNGKPVCLDFWRYVMLSNISHK